MCSGPRVCVAGDLVHVAGNFDRSFILHGKPNTDVSGKISKQKVSCLNNRERDHTARVITHDPQTLAIALDGDEKVNS